MPQFTPWAITNPAPNVLFNPAAVDQAIADTQSKLGDLDIRRQTLGLEQQKLDATQAGNRALLDGNTNPNTAPPADATPFEQQMGAAEGGSDPAAVNKQGYAGQFQFGSQRLADLGLYTPAPGEGKNEWKGQFHIAPYNVATLDDFLKNPAAQHAAFTAHVANIDQAINNTPGADKFDRNGLRAVAHLGGVGGMQAFVQSGGKLNSADANGTTLQNYYNRFAQGGAPLLQKSFGSVHGPGGPPSDLPAVRPGGNVSTAWIDPNAPLPVPPIPPAGGPPPFNPNAGPRVAGASPAGAPGTIVPPVTGGDPNAPVQIPPVGQARSGPIPPPPGGSADATPIAPSPIALRTGGTDVAGPGAGPDATLPAVAAPNQMYQTGIPGITIGGPPSNTLAPPPPAPAGTAPAATTAPPPMAQAQTAPPPAQRPTLPQMSPPPSRAIQTEPLIQGGPFDGLTQGQAQAARAAGASLVPTATLAAQMQTWRQQNIANRQTAATAAAAQQQAQIAQQQWLYEQQVKAGWRDVGGGMMQNDYTGERKYAGPPTPRIGRDESGRQFEVLPGGEMRYLTDNPSGVTGSGPDASAQRTMNDLAAKQKAGIPLTPQEEVNYSTATDVYRGAETILDPSTGGQVRVYKRDLPAGIPPPTGSSAASAGPQPVTPPASGYAEEQKNEAGRLSKLREEVINQAKESGASTTMITNTERAMAEAQKGNIGPNAIAPDRLNLVATAKALGVNLGLFGIDESKLAAGQVTREQLQQINGAILRKMYPQRITNADLAVSGSALPNYGLDPEALTANFNIYKSQNAYDTAKAKDMLAYEDAHNGSIRGWEHQWYTKNNFAPGPLEGLFGDAKSGALAGGDRNSSATTPTTGATTGSSVAANRDAAVSGQLYTDPKGNTRRKP